MKLLLQYLSLCFFRNNPAELYPSRSFMWKTVAFYLISGFIVEGLISDPADGMLEVLLRTIMAFASVATFLFIFKKWQYFDQLYIAIFVCENFIMTLATLTEAAYFLMVMKHVEDRGRNIHRRRCITGDLVYSDCQLYFTAGIRDQNEPEHYFSDQLFCFNLRHSDAVHGYLKKLRHPVQMLNQQHNNQHRNNRCRERPIPHHQQDDLVTN